MFGKCLLQGNKASVDISQLLVVLSDGRGVFADGTQVLTNSDGLIAALNRTSLYLHIGC